MSICPKCGHRTSGEFCGSCGARLPRASRYAEKREVISQTKVKDRAHKGVIRQIDTCIWLFLVAFLFTYVVGFLFGFIFASISVYISWIAIILVAVFVDNPVLYSQHIAGMKIYRSEIVEVKDVFEGFTNYGHIIGGMLWYQFRTFVWQLVPVMGAIKYYAYSLTPYILYDRPELSAEEAIKLSMKMTEGHKMELFVLDLSFVGWMLLSAASAGILGFTYIYPYYFTAWGGFYLSLAEKGTEASDTWECPHCYHVNASDSRNCDKCGYSRYAAPEPRVHYDPTPAKSSSSSAESSFSGTFKPSKF